LTELHLCNRWVLRYSSYEITKMVIFYYFMKISRVTIQKLLI